MKAASSIVILVSALTLSRATGSKAHEVEAHDAGTRLGELVTSRLRAGGPFFTTEEQALINSACGYAPGEWDGFQVNISDRVLTCTNGRRVDTPEIRRVIAAAEPRIERRVEEVMESADVREAIARISADASARASRAVTAAFAAMDEVD